jgi:hypothetical protein
VKVHPERATAAIEQQLLCNSMAGSTKDAVMAGMPPVTACCQMTMRSQLASCAQQFQKFAHEASCSRLHDKKVTALS